jgi:hypothetical protein
MNYMQLLSDTSPEAKRVLVEVYRQMPPARKWELMGEAFHTGKILHAAGYRRDHPNASTEELHSAWLAAAVKQNWSRPVGGQTVNSTDENLQVLREVIGALTKLNIPYALGGSWASSLLGEPRFTRDADISVEPFRGKEEALCACFGSDYYLSLEAIQAALQNRSSFNIINVTIGFKVDVFVQKERPFDRSFMDRRRPLELPYFPEQTIDVVTPEDIVLLKLEWFRIGGEVSDQQWKDVLGVLEAQAGKLDAAYLDHWASELKLTDLLTRARQQAVT